MYLIDGYNLLHALKDNRHAAVDHVARLRMLELLSMFARRKNRDVVCYLDGTGGDIQPGELNRPGVRVKFCGPESQSADRAICRFVEEALEPHELTVISNDREVRTTCRREGAKIITCDDFIEKYGDGSKRPVLGSSAVPAQSEIKEPMRREHFGDIEQAMLDEVGDLTNFTRRVLDEDEESPPRPRKRR